LDALLGVDSGVGSHLYSIAFAARPPQPPREGLWRIANQEVAGREATGSDRLSEWRKPNAGGFVREALAGIDVHLPFDVSAGWATQRYRRGEAAARKYNIIDATKRLEPFGSNLASAYHGLKNEMGAGHW